jgi:lipopolysaccharide/colanic/teichoic acid biosynthesis glycosyltransferase
MIMDLDLDLSVTQSRTAPYKRIFDLFGAAIGLIISLPISIIIAILIKMESPGSVIYRQERVGQGGNLFVMYKFRTMCENNSDLERELLANNPELQENFERFQKIEDNPRLTTVGRILRRTSMDEIPQFWNILKGEMSLVGPRPFLAEQKEIYGDAYGEYIRLRPGMTGLWQVSGRNRLSFQERMQLDVQYFCNQSFWLDLYILIKTILVVVKQDGAY